MVVAREVPSAHGSVSSGTAWGGSSLHHLTYHSSTHLCFSLTHVLIDATYTRATLPHEKAFPRLGRYSPLLSNVGGMGAGRKSEGRRLLLTIHHC